MAITALQLVAKITADTSGAEKGLKAVHDEADKTSGKGGSGGGGLKGVLGAMLGIAGGIGVIKVAGDAFGFVKDQVSEMVTAGMSANLVAAQTTAGLKSTHDASGMTAKGVDDLANSIMGMTGISSTAVQTGENMLLTFTNIGKNVFPRATQAAVDMATKMNGGLIPTAQQVQQQSILVGKALNDPIKGISALQRVGVTFTAQQKEQIKVMMRHGDVAGAQGVILKELNKEMGGSADAAGKANGGVGILTAQLDHSKEVIGQALIPIMTQLTGAVTPIVTQFAAKLPGALKTATGFLNSNVKPAMKDLTDIIKTKVAPAVKNITDKVSDFAGYLATHKDAMDNFKTALGGIAIVIATVLVASFVSWAIAAGAAAVATIAATWPLLALGAGIAILIIGIKALHDHWGQITKALGKFKDGVAKDVGNAFSGIGTAVHNAWTGAQSAVKGGINTIIRDVNGFIAALDKVQIHIPAVSAGPLHTPAFNWNGVGLSSIPYLAEGGRATRSGLAIVGDAGPELLQMPRGASVLPLGGSGSGSGGRIVVEVHTSLDVDGQTIARIVAQHLPQTIRNATGVRAF